MGSTCSKNNYSRNSSRKVLCENAMPIANLDETIGKGKYFDLFANSSVNYEVQSNTSRNTKAPSHPKPSTKDQ